MNGNSTEGMLHSDAITIIKHGGDIVKLIVRRVGEGGVTNSAGRYIIHCYVILWLLA